MNDVNSVYQNPLEFRQITTLGIF